MDHNTATPDTTAAKRLAAKRWPSGWRIIGQCPPEVSHLVNLEDKVKVMEAHVEIANILKHTPSELAYNQALERSIQFHKDLEFLITQSRPHRWAPIANVETPDIYFHFCALSGHDRKCECGFNS
jgi:DNA polymerase IIIc chi subunit